MNAHSPLPPGAVAVIGMAGRFPGASTPEALWRLVRNGEEAIRVLSEAELREAGVPNELLANPSYVRAAATLEDVDGFDAGFFGLSPRDASIMDPQHRHFLECAWEAIESAGYVPEGFDGSIGVFGGCGVQAYFARNLLQNRQIMRSAGYFLVRHTGNDKDFLTTRVSYQLNLTGPSVSVQTACSTSLAAIHLASQSLLSRECDMALAGGVTIELPHGVGYLYEEGEILSPDGHCRAFDASSKGTVFGSGVGIVVLRRLEDAVEAGDPIRAVILASALNNDGAEKVGYLAPSVDGQAAVVTEALAVAGINPESVTYIEAHGTGTPIGDPIEVAALTKAFRRETQARGFCAIGSLKTNIGHLDTASGVASLIKTVLALEHHEIPPSLHFERPNPAIPFDETPFYVSARLAAWNPAGPRRAGVTSLGVGGTNVHVILEEAPELAPSRQAEAPQLLVLSARSAPALEQAQKRLASHLQSHPHENLADVAWTLQSGRRAFAHRRHVVSLHAADAVEKLQTTGKGAQVREGEPGVVFLFPGGGAQYPGMGRTLYEQHPTFRRELDQVLSVVRSRHGIDLRPLIFPGTDTRDAAAAALEDSTLSILSVFAVEYALGRLWMAIGVQPVAMSGHSLGEYVAACLAGVFSLDDAVTIVKARGDIFKRLPAGAMLSVALPEADARAYLSTDVSLAAVNAPELCVLSGPTAQIQDLEQMFAATNVESKRLHIAVAAHSQMLDAFLDEFRRKVESVTLNPPAIPFISNLSGEWADPAAICTADYWVRHLRHTVRFSDGLSTLLSSPGRVVVEVGPGTALTTLARLHPSAGSAAAIVSSMPHAQDKTPDAAVFLSAVGTAWAHGQTVTWSALHTSPRRRVPLPTYPFEHSRYWIEPDDEADVPRTQGRIDSLEKLVDQSEWFRSPEWVAVPMAPRRQDNPTRLLLTTTSAAGSIAAALRAHGTCVVVQPGTEYAQLASDTFTVRPSEPEDYARLLTDLRSRQVLPDEVVHLGLADGREPSTDPTVALSDAIEHGFIPLFLMAQALLHEDVRPDRLVAVTRSAHRLDDDAESHPEQAIVDGLGRVVATELGIHFRTIDVRDVPSSLIAADIASASMDSPVALRPGGRFVETLQPWTPSKRPGIQSIRHRGVYLITGGGGGIATSLSERLARHHGAHVALIGRRRPAHMGRLQALVRALGGDLEFFTADVTDAGAMAAAVAAVRRRFGRLDGVFHAAGILDDALIASKSVEDCTRVLAPKVAGTVILDQVLRDVPIDFLVLFSSTSARLGLPGQADYAAANAFLGAFARSRSAENDRRTVAVGWGVWKSVGMTARVVAGGVPVATLPAHASPLSPFGARDISVSEPLRYTAVMSPREFWVLDGHRLVTGEAVLPGTGFIAWAYQVAREVMGSPRIEMRDVEFLRPLIFSNDDARTVVFECAAEGRFRWFSVWSANQPDDGTKPQIVEHAKGVFTPAGRRPGRWHGSSIHSRCPHDVHATGGMAANDQTKYIRFGPQWAVVEKQSVGTNETIMTLRLPDAFRQELTEIALHPALLDVAAAAGLALTGDQADGLFVPLGYGRVRIYDSLAPQIVSHVTLINNIAEQHMATFDVTIADTRGRILVELLDLTMRRVSVDALASGTEPDSREGADEDLASRLTAAGIDDDEGYGALRRVLAGGAGPEIIVSSVSLDAIRRHVASPTSRATLAVTTGRGGSDVVLNSTERTIARIWEDLLGVTDIGPDDDFFDLGGHSLIAVRLANRIEKQCGERIRLSSLLEARTVRQIAAMLGGGSSSQEASSLVALRASGDLPPLFVPHAVGGEVLVFTELARLLDPRQPFFAFRAVGHDGSVPPLDTIEQQAETYCREMLKQQPRGPYYLAGYSHGGRVAYEMAQRLVAAGHEVAFVGIIDTWPHEHLPRGLAWIWQSMVNLPKWLKVDLATTDLSGNVDRLQRAFLILRRKCTSLLKRQRLDRDVREDMDIGYLPDHVQRTYDANFRAFLAYRPRPYPGRVTLFRAYAQPLLGPHGRDLGWGTLARDLTVIDVPGSHGGLMTHPDVLDLARALRKALAEARARQETTGPSTQDRQSV